MLYDLRHTTRYTYAQPVDLGAHLVHLAPRALPHQRVLAATLAIEPAPTWRSAGHDGFGNETEWLFLEQPHDHFVTTLAARVEICVPPLPYAGATPAWQEIAARAAAALEAGPFLFPSPLVEPLAEARDYAERSFGDGRPILDALLDLNARMHRDFSFRAGITTVNTPVRQVLAQRAGVCQDFAHLMIAGLRALGLPARYVSGYVRAHADPGSSNQSHAWVGSWLGPQHGWVDLDPTNGIAVQNEHVVLGWGRDYGDVSPVRGVLLGGGAHTLDVRVELEPV